MTKSLPGDQDIRRQENRESGDQENFKARFETLWVWQKAYQLMLEVHKICKTLPREERFKRRDQLERSSSSAVDNIAEGYTSYYYKEKIKGFYTSRKEVGETQNHIRSLQGKSYIDQKRANNLIIRYEEVQRGINGFIRWVRQKRGDKK